MERTWTFATDLASFYVFSFMNRFSRRCYLEFWAHTFICLMQILWLYENMFPPEEAAETLPTDSLNRSKGF